MANHPMQGMQEFLERLQKVVYFENRQRQSRGQPPLNPMEIQDLANHLQQIWGIGGLMGEEKKETPMVKVTVLKKRNDQYPWGGWVQEDTERPADQQKQEPKKNQQQSGGAGKQQQSSSSQSQSNNSPIKQKPQPDKGNGNQQRNSNPQTGGNKQKDKGQDKDQKTESDGDQQQDDQNEAENNDGDSQNGKEQSSPSSGNNPNGRSPKDQSRQGETPESSNDDGSQDGDGSDESNSNDGSGQSDGSGRSGASNSGKRNSDEGEEQARASDNDGEGSGNVEGGEYDSHGEGEPAEESEDGIPAMRASSMGVTIEVYGDHRVETYDCFDDFISRADDQDAPNSNWQERASREQGKEEWAGTSSFEEAVALARAGWPQGVVKLDQIADHYHKMSKWTVDKTRHLDVAGTYPIVPVYLGGDPSCMINDGDLQRGIKPVQHIMVNRGYSWLTTNERIFNFGAALMVCIDQMETLGVRVELDVCTANLGDLFGPVSERPVWATITTIKKAQEYVEKNRLAFALAHPAYSRRLKYSLLEQIPNYEEPFHWGYGKPIPLPPDLVPPQAVYIPQLESWEKRNPPPGTSVWDKIDTAVAAMQKKLKIKALTDGTIELANHDEAA